MGAALQRAGDTDQALEFLEMARLLFPDDDTVSLELARAYRERGQYRTSAMLLERVGIIRGTEEHLLEAGELYRLAGQPIRALPLNARIATSEKRLRQRLGILLELAQYDRITTMEDDLARVGLLKTDAIRYAVAYAYFKVGNYERADALLGGIRDSELFRQATELRKAITDCRADPWAC
jgi:thioredoxin-like negative regulator of GroEL